jgi:diguanylate cyclase (GGDEF)-like protein
MASQTPWAPSQPDPAPLETAPDGTDAQRANSGVAATGQSALAQQADDRDQALAAGDQTASDRDDADAALDQAASDRDQAASDQDQRAADEVVAASDEDRARGGDPAAHERARETYEETTGQRSEASSAREAATASRTETAAARSEVAAERDRAAEERDRAARRRDELADARDEQIAQLERDVGLDEHGRGVSGELGVLRAANDRRRAAEDRRRAAAERAAGAREREQAALDRRHAREDREHAAADLATAGIDELTGALRRGVGLDALEREIDRARRVEGPLVLAFVDVDGLKQVNDGEGHLAGDELLMRVSHELQQHLRPYDLVVRYGGDEFLCVVPDARTDAVRRQLDEAWARLAATPGGGSFSVGFAELGPNDSIQDLIQRADAACLYQRYESRMRQEGSGDPELALGRLFRRPSDGRG